jgi:hypothetical protein
MYLSFIKRKNILIIRIRTLEPGIKIKRRKTRTNGAVTA